MSLPCAWMQVFITVPPAPTCPSSSHHHHHHHYTLSFHSTWSYVSLPPGLKRIPPGVLSECRLTQPSLPAPPAPAALPAQNTTPENNICTNTKSILTHHPRPRIWWPALGEEICCPKGEFTERLVGAAAPPPAFFSASSRSKRWAAPARRLGCGGRHTERVTGWTRTLPEMNEPYFKGPMSSVHNEHCGRRSSQWIRSVMTLEIHYATLSLNIVSWPEQSFKDIILHSNI